MLVIILGLHNEMYKGLVAAECNVRHCEVFTVKQ